MAGKVVFAEVIPAAVSIDGSEYFSKCWRHAAGHVVSPPLREDPLTGDYLLDLLSKSVNVLVLLSVPRDRLKALLFTVHNFKGDVCFDDEGHECGCPL